MKPPKKYSYEYLPVGTQVLLQGGRWSKDYPEMSGCICTIISWEDTRGHYTDADIKKMIPCRDSARENWFLSPLWPCLIVDQGDCIICENPIYDQVHYLCEKCRL